MTKETFFLAIAFCYKAAKPHSHIKTMIVSLSMFWYIEPEVTVLAVATRLTRTLQKCENHNLYASKVHPKNADKLTKISLFKDIMTSIQDKLSIQIFFLWNKFTNNKFGVQVKVLHDFGLALKIQS